MAQITIYGRREHLDRVRAELSAAIHGSVVDALAVPATKRFHRFIGLDDADFLYPDDRSERYTIIEISIFEGRTVETKKALIRGLFERIEAQCGIAPGDIEITIFETPRHNWGIRGLPADELTLDYPVET
jgi:phenylpyruvate tautomerase PptA (4-oxalocrotonate tautomerase family)